MKYLKLFDDYSCSIIWDYRWLSQAPLFELFSIVLWLFVLIIVDYFLIIMNYIQLFVSLFDDYLNFELFCLIIWISRDYSSTIILDYSELFLIIIFDLIICDYCDYSDYCEYSVHAPAVGLSAGFHSKKAFPVVGQHSRCPAGATHLLQLWSSLQG